MSAMSTPQAASKPIAVNGDTNGNNGSGSTPSASPAKSSQGGSGALEPFFCHQHKGGSCSGPSFQCTYLRPSGKRCGFRFCPTGLREIGIDPLMLVKVGLNDLSVEADEHTPLARRYYLQCPRCRGTCQCETCLEASSSAKGKGASKGGQAKGKSWAGFMQESSSNQKKSGTSKPKSSISKKATTTNAKAPASTSKGKKKDDAAPKAAGAGAKGKGKEKEKGKGKDKEQGTGQAPIKKARASNGKAVKIIEDKRPPMPIAPKRVLPPAPQIIETNLPIPNIEARIYLYETLVRLTDVIKVPKTTLGNLDRFEAWTSRNCQQLLERLLAAAAGLPYIDRGQPTKNTGNAVRAYREYGSQPLRGEPWEAARELIKKQLGRDVDDLPKVDRSAEEEREREEEDRLAALAAAAEVPALRVTRRMAAAEKRLMERHENGSDTDRSNRGGGGRRTANSRSAAVSDPSSRTSRSRVSSSLSRSRRKDLLGDDDDDDEDDDDSDEDSNSSNGRGSGRTAGRSGPKNSNGDGDGDEDMSDADSVSSKDTAGSAYQASDDEGGSNEAATVTAATSPPDSVHANKNGNGNDSAAPSAPIKEPVPAPHMEAKIAILCGLCDVVLQTPEASKEIKAGIDGVVQAEREHKATLTQMEKDWVVKRDALNNEAPSMAAENYGDWKQKKADAEREHKWSLIQENVKHALHLDTLKIRTGPIGQDVDGRLYWQLSEYIEKMPGQTGGRWAWCLLIQGPAFPEAPSEATTNGSGDASAAKVNGKKADDGASSASDLSSISASSKSSGLSSLPSDAEERKKKFDADALRPFGGFDEHGRPRNNFEVSIPVRPKGSGSVSSSSSTLSSLSTTSKDGEAEKNGMDAKAEQDGKVFMGTNYPSEIKKIIDWLNWRCAEMRHKGILWQIYRTEPFTAQEVADQKVEMAKAQARTDELVKALNKVREYYIWHLEEMTSIE
ncbi:hypothetical protein A4X13_0g881 [Tilletia indica]|uniref:Zinc-finger domain-containing protein n=1 Tax=Tilletia indica TaxID=43049 RepID=A0A177THE5_9BASI|nr:hypothetical protein A4X13_0g881 [Tilletia indica]